MAASIQAVPVFSDKEWSEAEKGLHVNSSSQEEVSSPATDDEATESRPYGMFQPPNGMVISIPWTNNHIPVL